MLTKIRGVAFSLLLSFSAVAALPYDAKAQDSSQQQQTKRKVKKRVEPDLSRYCQADEPDRKSQNSNRHQPRRPCDGHQGTRREPRPAECRGASGETMVL